MSIVEQFPSDGVFCVFVFFGGFVGTWATQMCKCTNSCFRGETVYNNLLVSLISKMTGGGSMTNSGGTPTSVFALSSDEQTMLDDDNDEDE